MRNEISFEFRKLFRQKTFYICGGVIIIISIIQVLLMYALQKLSGTGFLLGVTFIGCSGSDFLRTAAAYMEIPIIFPIFISLFVCVDFNTGTIKNVLSRGFTRSDVFFGKLAVISSAILIYYAAALFVSVLLGTAIFGFGEFELVYFVSMGIQILCILGFASMNAFISFMFRKIGPSLAIGILISTVVQLITQITDAVCELRGHEGVQTAKYTLTGCLQLAATATETGDFVWAAVVPVIYIALFLTFGWLIFRKREV